jgi:predicted TIM-barrel fold metal-dependent hydrolase
MKDGYRVIDIDTHVLPAMELLHEHGSGELRERWTELDPYLRPLKPNPGWGDLTEPYHYLSVAPIPYERTLGHKGKAELAEAGGKPALEGRTFSRIQRDPEEGIQHDNAAGRLRDMDVEGVDVNVIIPGTFSTASTGIEPTLAVELYAAYHRYLSWFCSTDTNRLKATMLAPAADPEWAAAEIARYADEPWVGAVTVLLPQGVPVDDPDLHPIWRAMGDADLPLLHHSFFYEPPYFPGYRDMWDNLVAARAAAHPWGAQRLVAYLILSGLFDQYPNLRVGFAETGASWLPFWLHRLRMQADYMRSSVPALKEDPVDYARQGRIFAGIEFYEGEELARSVIDTLGDGVLMYQSDFPHPQCEFPNSPEITLSWKGLGEDALRKIMAGNAENFLRML